MLRAIYLTRFLLFKLNSFLRWSQVPVLIVLGFNGSGLFGQGVESRFVCCSEGYCKGLAWWICATERSMFAVGGLATSTSSSVEPAITAAPTMAQVRRQPCSLTVSRIRVSPTPAALIEIKISSTRTVGIDQMPIRTPSPDVRGYGCCGFHHLQMKEGFVTPPCRWVRGWYR